MERTGLQRMSLARLKKAPTLLPLAAKQTMGGVAGALAALMIVYTNGKTLEIVSDASWKVAEQESRGAWRNAEVQ